MSSIDNDKIDVAQMPKFQRSIIGAKKRLSLIERQGKLHSRVQRIFHTFARAFEDIQKSMPGDSTELEAHEDRVCFQIKDVPISILYVPQDKPTHLNINKQMVLAERIFICDKYFGKNSFEMVAPSEREAGSIFICEDSYLLRWSDGTSYFLPTVYELADATISGYYMIHEMYKDRHNNDLEVNMEQFHHGGSTSLDLLMNSPGSSELNSSSKSSSSSQTDVKKEPLKRSANNKKNIKIFGQKKMNF